MSTTSSQPRKLRILMLHGYTQSGHLFDIKTKALQKTLQKSIPAAPQPGHLPQYPGGLEFVYPTAPIKLDPADIPGYDVDGSRSEESSRIETYGWWRRQGSSEPYVYEGMELGLASVAETLRTSGPFDGTLGFSQGGALAGILASLLEPGRREAFEAAQTRGGMPFPASFVQDSGPAVHPPLKFAVSYSGFGASAHELYQAFYVPKIATPMCHFLGSVDTVVSEDRSLKLVEACENGWRKHGGVPRVIYHPGGHFLPSSHKQYVAALIAFIREAVDDSPIPNAGEEVNVEDMDWPF